MKKFLVLIVLISLGLNVSLGVRVWKDNQRFSRGRPVWDQAGKHGPGGGSGPGGGRKGTFWKEVMDRRLSHVVGQLELDEEQEASFRSTHQKAAEGFLTQRSKVQEARRQLMEVASGSDFGQDRLRLLIAEVGRQQVKLDSMVTETMLQEMEILNDDQRRKYMSILPINRFGGRGNSDGRRSDSGFGQGRH